MFRNSIVFVTPLLGLPKRASKADGAAARSRACPPGGVVTAPAAVESLRLFVGAVCAAFQQLFAKKILLHLPRPSGQPLGTRFEKPRNVGQEISCLKREVGFF